ncbi:MAG: outer membrane beta-barrel protein, partial [Cruoricaptor ignavus]|nr:outer membrane beta-barrel protein [Cruoricaptor ignavus]
MKLKKLLIAAVFLNVGFIFSQEKPKTEKETNIEAVTVTKVKKAVEQKADRTIFDFSEQPHLNSGTVMEGVKKLPGLVVTDIAGMMYQGKMLDVYMDGRPLNISSNELNGFLEGMPANSVERIEIITQPGAEFPATSGGAILNIITSKTARNYLSATYSGNYSFTNYDKLRQRTNNSLSLNSRNQWFAWQLNIGQNYREGMMNGNIDDLSQTFTDSFRRGYFAKAGVTFELGEDRLLLNYDIYHNNNDNRTLSRGIFNGTAFRTDDLANTLNVRNEAVATYQKRFADKNKKLDFKVIYTNANSDFEQDNLDIQQTILQNESNLKNITFRIDYSQPIKILDEGKISFGGLYEKQNFETYNKGIQNLDYQRLTASSYAEIQAKLKQFDFTLGTRAEDYDISG